MKIIVVTGGRAYEDRQTVDRVLDFLAPAVVVQGGAAGADELARWWADKNKIETQTFKAQWESLGKRAGPIRNEQMLRAYPNAIVVAFPGGAGTANCVEQAKKFKMTVLKVMD